jgi:hypothetical protein
LNCTSNGTAFCNKKEIDTSIRRIDVGGYAFDRAAIMILKHTRNEILRLLWRDEFPIVPMSGEM